MADLKGMTAMWGHLGSLLSYAWIALFAAGALTLLGVNLRTWKRNAPLRERVRDRPVTFRTDLSWVSFPDSPTWRGRDRPRGEQLIIRGDLVQVGTPFGSTLGNQCYYFRAPETTIEVSRDLPAIYGIDSRREWIVVRSRQDGRVQVSMAKKYFFDDVWNALVTAGAVPTTDGPTPRNAWRDTRAQRPGPG
jgi:hypothetical protein